MSGSATASVLKKIGRAGVCPVFANLPHRQCTACVSGECVFVLRNVRECTK